MRDPASLFFSSLLLANTTLACINTSYSADDERVITNDTIHLILGQFPAHSSAFYEHERQVSQAALDDGEERFEIRNDLGAALTKLQRYPEAEAAFLENDSRYPNRYETESNLGVLYKKMGKYSEAAAAIRRALEIRPGGHMGLGDYYLRMLEWLALTEAQRQQQNFLGLPYDLSPAEIANHPDVRLDYLLTLIKNDRHFANAYVVLGDLLSAQGKQEEALRAYLRVEHLDPKWQPELVKSRQRRPAQAMSRKLSSLAAQFNHEMINAEVWLHEFQSVETGRIGVTDDLSFAATLTFTSPKPQVIGLGQMWDKPRRLSEESIIILAFLAALLLGLAFMIGRDYWIARYRPLPSA